MPDLADEPSVFLNLRQGAEFFLGRLPAMPAHERLLKCWRGSLDTECALFPVRVRDRLVCAVYGDRDSLGLAGLAPGKPLQATLHHEDGGTHEFQVNHTLNADQVEWFKAGSALNVLKAK